MLREQGDDETPRSKDQSATARNELENARSVPGTVCVCCSTLKDMSRRCDKCYSVAARPVSPRPPRLMSSPSPPAAAPVPSPSGPRAGSPPSAGTPAGRRRRGACTSTCACNTHALVLVLVGGGWFLHVRFDGHPTDKTQGRKGQGRDKEPDRNLTPYGQGTGHYGQGTGHYRHPTDTRGHEETCPRALLGPHLR